MPEQILHYLEDNGEQLDRDIAAGIGRSLASVTAALAQLVAKGDIVMCHSIQFRDGGRVEGMRCRLSAYTPPMSPGRRAA